MYERCLNEAERVLSVHREVVVPVKLIWEEVAKEGRRGGFEVSSLADFTALLEGDRRFEIIPASEEPEELPEELESEEETEGGRMESLGFYAEDRVRLRNLAATRKAEEEKEEEEEVGSIRRKAFASGVARPAKESPARTAKAPKKRAPGKQHPRTTRGSRPKRKPALKARKAPRRSRS